MLYINENMSQAAFATGVHMCLLYINENMYHALFAMGQDRLLCKQPQLH